MFFCRAVALVLAFLAPAAVAQDVVYGKEHNATTLWGTWSSGSGAVLTGSGFAIPSNETFIYPNNTGISYSFTDDGYYEISRFRFVSNASYPSCITGTMIWVHGKYDFVTNGSIILYPVFSDGYQQVQDRCAADSNFMQDYNYTELIDHWLIGEDATKGYYLQLYTYDGSALAPQYQVSTTPIMLPTYRLRNSTTSTRRKRELDERNAASGFRADIALGGLVTAFAFTAAALVL